MEKNKQFKERMNLYRAYRELNPGKNYWDWKLSLEVPAMLDRGNTEDSILDPIRQYIDGGILDKNKVYNRVKGDMLGNDINYSIMDAVRQYLFNDDSTVDEYIEAIKSAKNKYSNYDQNELDSLVADSYKIYLNYLRASRDRSRTSPEYKDYSEKFNASRANFIIAHEDAKDLYLGLPLRNNTVIQSKYKPSVGNASQTYYTFTPLQHETAFQKPIVDAYNNMQQNKVFKVVNDGKFLGLLISAPEIENADSNVIDVPKQNRAVAKIPLFGSATVSAGVDPNKGQYVSVYDVWDYNTAIANKHGDNVGKYIGGAPFELYDRIYLDDFYGVSSKPKEGDYYGGYLPEITIKPVTQYDALVPAMQDGGNTEDYQPTSEIPTYWDEESQSFKSGMPRVIGMSGTDPIGEAYVTGKAFTKALDIIGDAYRWKSRTDAVNNYRDWLRSSEWNRSSNVIAKRMRERLKEDYRKYGGDGGVVSNIANDITNAVQIGVKWGEKLLGFENGGVVPAMQDGGENKPLQDPTIKTITFPDGSTVLTLLPWANQQGLLNTPIADMFNPANDAYDLVLVGKDATEGNWAGVGAGLVLAAMPKWMEKVGGAAKSGVKKLINKVRRSDNVNWDEIVSGLAVPIKKDPISPNAMPISDKIKFDDTHVAGLSGQTSPRYLDYGTVEFLDHIGYTRPQWIRDVQEFYNKDVAAREREFATNQGILYTKPNLLNRADITFSENHPVEVRLYLDDVAFGGYANKKRIVLTRGTKLPADQALVHEGAHIDLFNIDELLVPTTEHRFHDIDGHILVAEYPVPELENILNRAYTFTDDFLERYPDVHEMFEAGASNREMRYLLWKEHGKPNVEELDKIIDNMSDDDIRYLLTQANAYTRNFNKFITEDAALSGLDPHYYVEAIKQALKYVPALAAPVMIHNTEDKSN